MRCRPQHPSTAQEAGASFCTNLAPTIGAVVGDLSGIANRAGVTSGLFSADLIAVHDPSSDIGILMSSRICIRLGNG